MFISYQNFHNFIYWLRQFKYLNYSIDNLSTMDNATPKISTSVNPWTNKTKIRGQGRLNSIFNKYLNENEQVSTDTQPTLEQKQYLQITHYIQKKYQPYNIMDAHMTNLFQLKKRCEKIDEILQWIDKLQNRTATNSQNRVQEQKNRESKIVPIDSSFIYLPIHSGTVFHEILKDCTAKDKPKGLGQYRNLKLKQALQSMRNIQNFPELLQSNIL